MTAAQRRAWRLAPAALVVFGALAAWLVLPTAPNYDTATHLIWARELLAGAAPEVSASAAPTPHPLWLLAAVVASATGGGASLLQLVALLAYGVVVVAVWRLASSLAGRVAAAAAALITLSSFALLLSAYKAYADLPFLALVLCGVLAEQRPGGARRWLMPVLLLLAGLLRPEAWAFGLLLLLLRRARGVQLPQLLGPALVIAAAPMLWAAVDLALTGDPLHSLTGTQALAEELGRRTGLAAAPVELVLQLGDLLRPPVALAGVFGVAATVWLAGWRPVLGLLAPLAAGAAGFLLIGALGLPLLQRYLLLPGVLLAVFAGVGIAVLVEAATGGALPVAPGPVTIDVPALASGAARRAAITLLAVGALGTAGYLVLKADSFAALGRGVLREARWQRQAAQLVGSPEVRRRLQAGCGPITLPTYRLVPELQLAADLPTRDVVSRARELGGIGPQSTGIALTIVGDRAAKERMGWAAGVPRSPNAIPPGFVPVQQLGPILVAARCR